MRHSFVAHEYGGDLARGRGGYFVGESERMDLKSSGRTWVGVSDNHAILGECLTVGNWQLAIDVKRSQADVHSVWPVDAMYKPRPPLYPIPSSPTITLSLFVFYRANIPLPHRLSFSTASHW